jgi:hypothetical protein
MPGYSVDGIKEMVKASSGIISVGDFKKVTIFRLLCLYL